MKSLKRSLEPPKKSDLQELLQTASICLDTNALINLFRYSTTTCDEWLDALEAIKGRLILPHQVGIEFYRNLPGLPKGLDQEYTKVETALSSQKKHFVTAMEYARGRHPAFADEKLEEKAKSLLEQLDTLLSEAKREYKESLGHPEQIDTLSKRVEDLFDKTTLTGFTRAKLMQIYAEGAHRYELLIPPGFEDAKQKPGYRKYGDLVIWKELLRYAKKNHKSVILVTADDKDDWWDGTKGKRKGPRQELREEFHEKTGQEFYAYSPQQFLKLIQKLLEKEASKEALDETRAVSRASSLGPAMSKYIRELSRLDNSTLIEIARQSSSSSSAWKSVADLMATNPSLNAIEQAAASMSAAVNSTGFESIAEMYKDIGLASYWANQAGAKTILEQISGTIPNQSIPNAYYQIIENLAAIQAFDSRRSVEDDKLPPEDDQADDDNDASDSKDDE